MELDERILRTYDTIAVVGASRDPSKAAHDVPLQLQRAGFRIVPVNPYADELFGTKAYRALAEIPFSVDVVLVFRPSAEAARIAQEAVAIRAKALWLQLGLHSGEARSVAEGAGLLYVEDTCSAVVRSLHRIDKR